MKTKIFLAGVVALAIARPVSAVWPVTVDAIVDPSFIANQAEQIANLVATVKQAEAIYTQARQLNEMFGDPKRAVRTMIDTSAFTNEINRQLAGGTSYLSGIPGLDEAQQTMALLNGGVEFKFRLLPGDPNAAAADDERSRAARMVVMPDGSMVPMNPHAFDDVDAAEAVARAAKAALIAQAKAREQAGSALRNINRAMADAQTESEKQALASQYAAIAAQMQMLNGQLAQMQYEYDLQRDRDQRLADQANIADQQQAVVDANATTTASDAQAAQAAQAAAAARARVQGNPMNLDYTKIR